MITVVLDDDPTGTQEMNDVSVVLDWSDPAVWSAVAEGDRAVHVLTNSRAHTPAEARRLVASAATAARGALPDSRLILRGDSTLRAHLWEEYEGLRSVIQPGRDGVPLLLVPALPKAGRITLDGVHLIERDGRRVSLENTEYATDGVFAYSSAVLSRWAQERSGGRLAASDAITIDLATLRGPGQADAVAAAIARSGELGRPAVVVPDAENEGDLEMIAAGLRLSEDHGDLSITRCAPAFVAALASMPAALPPQPPSGEAGVLVICGSFVPLSTAQIERLGAERPEAMIPVNAAALAGDQADREVERAVGQARVKLASGGVAVVVTDRRRNPALIGGRRAAARRISARAGRERGSGRSRDRKGWHHLGNHRSRGPRRAGGARARTAAARRRPVAARRRRRLPGRPR